MIDVGEGAYPAFFDVDDDGLKDILIGNYGYFDKNNPNIYSSQLAYYRNTGDATHPSFQLMNNDFAGIAALGVKGVCPHLLTLTEMVTWICFQEGMMAPCFFSGILLLQEVPLTLFHQPELWRH
jgi:hypothetical protein